MHEMMTPVWCISEMALAMVASSLAPLPPTTPSSTSTPTTTTSSSSEPTRLPTNSASLHDINNIIVEDINESSSFLRPNNIDDTKGHDSDDKNQKVNSHIRSSSSPSPHRSPASLGVVIKSRRPQMMVSINNNLTQMMGWSKDGMLDRIKTLGWKQV
jgi:hypothetical protein